MDELLKRWPAGPDGTPEEAALLENEGDFAGYGGLHCSVLEAYGIPYLTNRSGPGQVGLIYGGYSPEGVRIYVPKSRLEQAKELLNAPALVDEDENEEEVQ